MRDQNATRSGQTLMGKAGQKGEAEGAGRKRGEFVVANDIDRFVEGQLDLRIERWTVKLKLS